MADWSKRNGRGGGSSEEMLDSENQLLAENMASKVSRLKGIAFDMETETKDQNRYLGSMDMEFDSSTGLLGGSMNRINHMISTGKSNRKLMCYLILGLVLVFIVAYQIISRIGS